MQRSLVRRIEEILVRGHHAATRFAPIIAPARENGTGIGLFIGAWDCGDLVGVQTVTNCGFCSTWGLRVNRNLRTLLRFYNGFLARRRGRVAEGGGLLNRYTV